MAFDKVELDRLRARYADDPGGRMHDPKFAKVAERVFSRGARPAPFVGVPTFLTAPHRIVDRDAPDFSELDVAIEAGEEITPNAVEQVVAVDRAARRHLLDEVEAGLGTEGHRDGDGAVELDDR